MTSSAADSHQPRAVSGLLVLADIAGYTSFLQDVHAAHEDDAFADGAIPDAYAMMSSLLDGIVARLVPPFELSKLEGDAVFVYAVGADEVPRGAAVLECVQACYADFRRRLGEARGVWQCWCDACARVDALDLKFIVHAGHFVIQAIAAGRELVGPEVVMAHRLLKSRAEEVCDHRAYVLITQAAAEHLEIPTGAGVPIVETYDHYAPVTANVFPLGTD